MTIHWLQQIIGSSNIQDIIIFLICLLKEEEHRAELSRRISVFTGKVYSEPGSGSDGSGKGTRKSSHARRKSSVRRLSRMESQVKEKKDTKKKALIMEETAEEGNVSNNLLMVSTFIWEHK